MRDRKQEHLGVYTKAHGFMTVDQFAVSQKGDERTRPVQVTAVEYRRLQADIRRKAAKAAAVTA